VTFTAEQTFAALLQAIRPDAVNGRWERGYEWAMDSVRRILGQHRLDHSPERNLAIVEPAIRAWRTSTAARSARKRSATSSTATAARSSPSSRTPPRRPPGSTPQPSRRGKTDVARDIGMAPNALVYRAVITKSYPDGTTVTEYEGPYGAVGPARGRVTFWRNHLAKRDDGATADGYVEQSRPTWEKASAPGKGAVKAAVAPEATPSTAAQLVAHALTQRRGMHGKHAAELLDEHGHTKEADLIRREVRDRNGHLSAKQALELLTATAADTEAGR
jgi:hypothetical protein